MWDENKVTELLKDMPQSLTDENLMKIQKLIDDNKYWSSQELNKDLCGSYAPFCRICDKSVLTPCAVAYVRMKIAAGGQLEMQGVTSEVENAEALKSALEEYALSASEESADQAEEKPAETEEESVGDDAEPVSAEEPEEKVDDVEEEPAEESEQVEEETVEEPAEEIIEETAEEVEEVEEDAPVEAVQVEEEPTEEANKAVEEVAEEVISETEEEDISNDEAAQDETKHSKIRIGIGYKKN